MEAACHNVSPGADRTAVAGRVALRRWARCLRNNAPRQVRGMLRRVLPDGTVLFCAIGALEEAMPSPISFLFPPQREAALMRHVVLLNDELGWTFPQIADWLETIADGRMELDDALLLRRPDELPPRVPEAALAG